MAKLFFILLLVKSVLCVNILHLAHIASPSHHIWNRVLSFALAEKGYNVTMVSHDQEKQKHKNFHLILLEGFYEKTFEDFSLEALTNNNPISGGISIYDWSYFVCEHDFTTKGLTTLLNYPKDFKFDLIIFDVTIGQCMYPLIERFGNPPVIGVTPFLLPPTLSYSWGNPMQPAYFPYYSTTFTEKMSFAERILNFIYISAEILYRKYVALPTEMKLAEKYFGKGIRPFEEVERNISLLLSNTDSNMIFPIDLPPNIIPVGGMQVRPTKPLPADIQEVVDEAKSGIILFTLGSNLRSDMLSPDRRKVILNAFAKLPQTVFWKFETDNLEGLPKNVYIRKWLPQSDLLANPKTKLFISHGGGLGTQEAMYHGVPVVGIPFSFDHIANMNRLVTRKMAKTVNFNNFTYENFYGSVSEVLNDPSYTENIKKLSKRYKDQPQKPLDRAVFWVEYVLRHGGADHLVLAARDMPFYQILSWDILIAFGLAVVLLYSVLVLLFTVLKFVFQFFISKPKK